MADSTALAARLATLSAEDRKSVLTMRHPVYEARLEQWNILLDAYEGGGGFLDGSYLWRYPREEYRNYLERQSQARYHNFAQTLINIYVRHVLGRTIVRDTTDARLLAWWQDVDGEGTDIQTFLVRATQLALMLGHVGILMDKTPTPPTGPSAADERARPFLTLYLPQAILDWRLDRAKLIGLKLAEAVPDAGILEPATDASEVRQYLVWTPEEWARYGTDGELVDGPMATGEHGLGRVPCVVLRPAPSAQHQFIGQSLFGTGANTFRALYNRNSEEDEVLRSQSFSLFVLTANSADDVERIKQQFSGEVGTTRAVVTAGTANYVTPDQAVPQAIRENAEWLIKELYRAAHIRYERDTLVAESADAIRLQHTELNEMLAALSRELQRVEQQLVELYYAWTTPTPEAAAASADKAGVTITYPSEFFVRAVADELADVGTAIGLGLGRTFTQTLKKRIVRRMEPTLSEAQAEQIDAEIDAQAETSGAQTMADQIRENATARLAALTEAAP